MDAAAAAALIEATDSIGLPLGPGQPTSFLHALGERESFDDLRVSGALLIDLYPLFLRPGVHLRSGFFGPAERLLRGEGADVQFVPGDFRRFRVVLEQFRPRVMATAVAPSPDGRLNLSLHAGATIEEILACGRDPDRLLIVERCAGLPRTCGLPPEHPHSLSPDEVDVVIEGNRPVFEIADPAPTDVDRAIAGHVRPFIHDGCTLQTGIGSIPSLIVQELARGDGGDYGVHSEMFTTGLMELHRAGKVTNQKGVYDGFSVCTFAGGTRALYDWLDGNEEVVFLPVDQVNDPAIIAQNRSMISINGALSVDLAGQIAADTRGGGQFSGIGGHEDFVAGTGRSLNARSLVCLPSTARVGDRLVSRIAASLGDEMLVTTPRHQTDVVVTEFGAAELFGRTAQERAAALIEVAHPDFRDALRKAPVY